jgi:hypothetical protein
MTKWLGVKIGLAKSIQSRYSLTFEFAKKYWVRGQRAFAFPLRDAFVSQLSTSVLNECITKNDISLDHYLQLRGMGYKARGSVTGRL